MQVGVPTIELVDLPGIQLYPPKVERETVSLVSKYLADPETLVLCVVDATIPSLDSSPAVKMVREAGKLSSTILALTKADLVCDQDLIAADIFDRILCRSAEMQELEGLAGCVSLINRKHTDQLSLLEAEAAEAAAFSKLFDGAADAYTAKEIQAQLRENSTSSRLIAKLDALFHTHILDKWKPAALKSIQRAIRRAEKDDAHLGVAPERLTLADVVTVLSGKVRLRAQCLTCLSYHLCMWSYYAPSAQHPLACCSDSALAVLIHYIQTRLCTQCFACSALVHRKSRELRLLHDHFACVMQLDRPRNVMYNLSFGRRCMGSPAQPALYVKQPQAFCCVTMPVQICRTSIR